MYPNYYPNANSNYFPNYQQQTPYAQVIGHNGSLAGRFVNDFNEITANEVPMDGSYATFVKNDMSELQLRKWNANGTISKTSYKPILDTFDSQMANPSSESQKCLENDVSKQINDLKAMIGELSDKVEKICTPPTPAKKKVGASDGE